MEDGIERTSVAYYVSGEADAEKWKRILRGNFPELTVKQVTAFGKDYLLLESESSYVLRHLPDFYYFHLKKPVQKVVFLTPMDEDVDDEGFPDSTGRNYTY